MNGRDAACRRHEEKVERQLAIVTSRHEEDWGRDAAEPPPPAPERRP